MGVGLALKAPFSADRVMLGDEIPADTQLVQLVYLLAANSGKLIRVSSLLSMIAAIPKVGLADLFIRKEAKNSSRRETADGALLSRAPRSEWAPGGWATRELTQANVTC